MYNVQSKRLNKEILKKVEFSLKNAIFEYVFSTLRVQIMIRINFRIEEMSPAMARALSTQSFYNGFILGLKDIGAELVDTADEGIRNPPKSGRVYHIKGRIHQASAPGQYPANISDTLRNSLDFTISGLKMRFGAKKSSSQNYAEYLQQVDSPLKNQTIRKQIKARPFLTLSHRKKAPTFQSTMRDRVFNTLNK
jgi:hypothetical protein